MQNERPWKMVLRISRFRFGRKNPLHPKSSLDRRSSQNPMPMHLDAIMPCHYVAEKDLK